MIKKNTKIIFEDGRIIEDSGGIPLTEGEIIAIKTGKERNLFRVNSKSVECEQESTDLIADITYKLSKIN